MSGTLDYRTVLADMRRKRAALDAVIAGLEALIGETSAVVAEAPPPRRVVKRVKGDTARPTGAPAERILAALKQAGAPMSPGQLAAATKMSVGAVGYHVRALARAKQVHAEGATTNRRLSLA